MLTAAVQKVLKTLFERQRRLCVTVTVTGYFIQNSSQRGNLTSCSLVGLCTLIFHSISNKKTSIKVQDVPSKGGQAAVI